MSQASGDSCSCGPAKQPRSCITGKTDLVEIVLKNHFKKVKKPQANRRASHNPTEITTKNLFWTIVSAEWNEISKDNHSGVRGGIWWAWPHGLQISSPDFSISVREKQLYNESYLNKNGQRNLQMFLVRVTEKVSNIILDIHYLLTMSVWLSVAGILELTCCILFSWGIILEFINLANLCCQIVILRDVFLHWGEKKFSY